MRRTVATLLLVGVLAVPVALTTGLVSTGAAAAPTIDPGASSRQSDGPRITHLDVADRGVVVDQESIVQGDGGAPFVWASEPLRIQPTVHTDPDLRTNRACARLVGDGEALGTVGCRTWNTSSRYRLATVELSQWPPGARGRHRIRVDLYEAAPDGTAGTDGGTGSVLWDSRSFEVHVIGKQGDLDGDGLANAREVAEGTDFTRADTDGDGLSDRAEVYQYGSDPLATDTTGDGIGDGTTATLRLPPTVPYAFHGVVVALLLGAVALAFAASRLRRVLETGWDAATGWEAATYGDAGTFSAVGTDDGDGALRSTKEGEVLAVLREHGGRMRQADLVDETEWSKATVSRLLSTLEDDGRVEKIRVGRGNVVQLTGGAGSLDDERSRLSG